MDKLLKRDLFTVSNARKLIELSGIKKLINDSSGGGLPVGATTPFAGNGDQGDWLICDGRSLSSSEYPELYAIIGSVYGGSGGTFNLPDCRGRTIIGVGQGNGLTNRQLGDTPGSETVTLGVQNIPSHSHTMDNAGGHDHGGSTENAGGHNHGGSTGDSNPAGTHDHPFSFQREAVFQAGSNRAGVFNIQGNNDNANRTTDNRNVPMNHNHVINSDGSHSHTINNDGSHNHTIHDTGGDQSHNNMQPSLAMNILIKAR